LLYGVYEQNKLPGVWRQLFHYFLCREGQSYNAANRCGIAEDGEFQHYCLIELEMFNYFRQPNSIASAPLAAILLCVP
jgi:hypothetical protein